LPIYLDYSASHPVYPQVRDDYLALLDRYYANSASVHPLGREASQFIDQSRRRIAQVLGCQDDEIILTSGGSESINLAIKGYVEANPRLNKRIITSLGEHAATTETVSWLKKQGYDLVSLSLQSDGCVDPDAFAEALRQPAALISLIHVNNETGAVNPIEEIVGLRNRLQPRTAIHIDGVQTIGRMPFCFKSAGIDMMSGSGHKIGAPKGIGWLLIRRGIHLAAQIHGGGQQRGLRSGTENPPLAGALAHALRLATEKLSEQCVQVAELRSQLLSHLTARKVDHQVLSPPNAVPHILMVAFPGLRGETLLHALSAKGIYVSTGAACSSKRRKDNPVLQAMGIPAELAGCAVRISLSAQNTSEEISETALAIDESCRRLIQT
jgi:cysteine desulfurase